MNNFSRNNLFPHVTDETVFEDIFNTIKKIKDGILIEFYAFGMNNTHFINGNYDSNGNLIPRNEEEKYLPMIKTPDNSIVMPIFHVLYIPRFLDTSIPPGRKELYQKIANDYNSFKTSFEGLKVAIKDPNILLENSGDIVVSKDAAKDALKTTFDGVSAVFKKRKPKPENKYTASLTEFKRKAHYRTGKDGQKYKVKGSTVHVERN